MKHVLPSCIIFLACVLSPLRAGYVVTISDGREQSGKVTITATTIQVTTSSSPTDINFSEILEADFGDDPFSLNIYSSDGAKGTQFPANWKAQDIGEVDAPGSGTVSDGVFNLSGSGNFSKPKKGKLLDRCFFAGQQWSGDGEFTARIQNIDAQTLATAGGIMLRDTLDNTSAEANLETTALGGALFSVRAVADTAARPTQLSLTPPAWVRLTRFGNNIFASLSTDKVQWDLVGEADFKGLDNPWVGIYAHTRRDKEQGKVTFDDVSFTPAPSSALVFPPGVILVSGSFVAADCAHLQFEANNPDAQGNFNRNGSLLNIAASQISAITMLPLTRAQIDDLGSHKGLLMKNGDAMDGDPDSITQGNVTVNSVLLGIVPYERTAIRACVLHPLQAQPAKYDIRLKDGSIIYAGDVAVSGDSVSITDLSGLKIFCTMGEIAQFRAGSAQIQSLAELAWKATPPPVPPAPAAPAPAGAAAPAAAINVAPAVAPGIAANPPPDAPPIQNWAGPNEEQVMETSVGTKIDFPLTGKFRAVALRIMISPDSPPNGQATVRIMADGRDVGSTPLFKVGDQPRFVQVALQDPKTLTIVAESPFATTKILYIDPVVIRN